MLTDKQIREIRSRFSIFQRKIYLNTCSQGALSDAVQAGHGGIHCELARARFAVGDVGEPV
jgi:hypothetical protein